MRSSGGSVIFGTLRETLSDQVLIRKIVRNAEPGRWSEGDLSLGMQGLSSFAHSNFLMRRHSLPIHSGAAYRSLVAHALVSAAEAGAR